MQEADGRPVAAIHGDARRGRRAVVGVERAGAGRTQDSRTPTLRPLPSEPLPPRPGTLGMELRLVLTGLFSSPHKEGTTPTPSQSWAPTEREEIYFFVSRQWILRPCMLHLDQLVLELLSSSLYPKKFLRRSALI